METMEIGRGRFGSVKNHRFLLEKTRLSSQEIAGKLLPPGDARFGYAESYALDLEDWLIRAPMTAVGS